MRDAEAVEKRFAQWRRLREEDPTNQASFNTALLSKRDFHTPGMDLKMLQYAELNQDGTTIPTLLPKHSSFDYEVVSKAQRDDWERQNPQEATAAYAGSERPTAITLEYKKPTSSSKN